MRYFAVRSREDPEKFASPNGWACFQHSTVFTFKDDRLELIEAFRKDLDQNFLEMVEILFHPMDAPN